MDERQSKWLVALSAVLALLVMGIVFMEPPGPDLDDGRRWTRHAKGRTAEAVTGISLQVAGQTVRIERVAGAWRWVEPVDVSADGARVDALVRSVLDVELGDPIEVQPEAVGLGTEAPAVSLDFAGAERVSLKVGEDAPVGSSTYVLDDSGTVRATRSRLSTALPTSLEELRSRAVVTFPRTDVFRIEVGSRGDHPAKGFIRNDHGWWLAGTEPLLRASETHVNTVLDALRYAEAEAFLDSAPPLADDAWAITVEFGSPPQSTSLRLARATDGTWLAEGPEQPAPVQLAATDLVQLLSSPEGALVESRVLIVRPTRLETLEVRLDDTSVTAQRTPDGWSDPAAEPLLVALETGVAARTPPPPVPSGEPTGLIRVVQGSDSTSVTLYQTLDSGDRVATEAGTERAFRVSAGTVSALRDALQTAQ